MKQQQAMMELYKKEKIIPLAGCLRLLVQIPIFFALYKVLFVTDRNASRAVLRLDSRILLRPIPRTSSTCFGLLPSHHRASCISASGPSSWHHDVGADEDEPEPTDRSRSRVRVDAAALHLHAGLVPGWPRDLLGLEQPLSVLQQYAIMKKLGTKVELWTT